MVPLEQSKTTFNFLFGFKNFLFELPETLKVQDVESYIEKEDEKLYNTLRTKSLISNFMGALSRRHGGFSFDVNSLTKEGFARCVEGISFRDLEEICREAFPRFAKSDDDINQVATFMRSVGSNRGLVDLSRMAAKILGAENCLHIDVDVVGFQHSNDNMNLRNEIMARRVIANLGSIGCFGVAHFDSGSNHHDIGDIMQNHFQRGKNNDLRNVVVIYPFMGEPLWPSEVIRRQKLQSEKYQDRNPLSPYAFDATNCDSENFVSRVVEIVRNHQERFAEGLKTVGRAV